MKYKLTALVAILGVVAPMTAQALSPEESKCYDQANDLNGAPRRAFLDKCMSRVPPTSEYQARMRALEAASTPGNWHYYEETDKMDGSETKYAEIISENSLSLDFPYRGENRGRVIIRQQRRQGLNVIFMIDKGQLMCHSYDGCRVQVRFDDAQPISFSGTGPNDNDSKVVFLRPERKFIEQAMKAKQIRVAVTIYQAGTQVLEFSTAPLVWGPAVKKK